MKRVLIALAAVVALVLVLVFVFHVFDGKDSGRQASSNTAATRDIGAGVHASNNAPAEMKATEKPDVHPTFKQTTSLTPVVEITPPGELRADVTLKFNLARPAPLDNTVVVATAESAQGPWKLVPATLSEDGRSVSVKTRHLSFWSVLRVSVEDIVKEFNNQFLTGITSNLTAKAEHPKCAGENEARGDGYDITSSAKETLYWCFGIEGGQRVLKVINRLRYPLEVKHPGFERKSGGRFQLKLEELANIGAGKSTTILSAFDEAVFTVSLNRGQKAQLDTAYSGYAQSLGQLELGITLLGSILTRFGAGEGIVANGAITKTDYDRLAKYVDGFLGFKDCADAFLKLNPGDIFASCFSPKKIMEIFGWKGLLLAPVIVASQIVEFFHSSLNILVDHVTDRDEYRVVVVRVDAIAPFVGEWTAHHQLLEIKADSTGTYKVTEFCTDSLDSLFCTVAVQIKFQESADGLTGKVTGWRSYDTNNAPAPPEFRLDGDQWYSHTFRIQTMSDHRLKVDGSMFCSDRTQDTRECGA